LVAAAPPSVTDDPAAKLVPVMRMAVPPAAGPDDGAIADTVGDVGVGVIGGVLPPHDPSTIVSATSATVRRTLMNLNLNLNLEPRTREPVNP